MGNEQTKKRGIKKFRLNIKKLMGVKYFLVAKRFLEG